MSKSSCDGKTSAVSCNRRRFLIRVSTPFAGLAVWPLLRFGANLEAAPRGEPKLVTIVEFSDAGQRGQKLSVALIQKTEEEWRKELTPAAFVVARQAGTERPFSGDLLNIHDKGVFRCICCYTALFSSATKFDSGTGWPSFWAPIAKENVVEFADNRLGMQRIAVSCRRCEAHLGHVFDDGPQPTGLRYCMNSVALRFAKA